MPPDCEPSARITSIVSFKLPATWVASRLLLDYSNIQSPSVGQATSSARSTESAFDDLELELEEPEELMEEAESKDMSEDELSLSVLELEPLIDRVSSFLSSPTPSAVSSNRSMSSISASNSISSPSIPNLADEITSSPSW
ncbi:hypothetical protein SCHPADRAFT_947716 [Schizopora paradoxa]|uniref:Uncharacterized protein n=1 Tax=Schizopora paradoxa TaxID=27342 RepID=A0A0H2QXY3_9AGAM|nr:hypothetical protein SCHPADRAFT_947716 [Schizopora paradoxa]